ncbi:hypothetical protein MHB84_05460 [Paenibacillus sp. FSL F4-0087]|uniref:hypothetical protein n=1 Tax=Paenibacillus sp. FSL F4-0087 TaxID=2921368 RepID=UPI00096FB6B1|nr:hypothetical protein BK122_27410 [Paenibacillus pabuli]
MIRVYCDIKESTKAEINKTINDYLDLYMDFYRTLGPEEFSSFFPQFLWVENEELCIKTMIELDLWTSDNYLHTLKPIHEFALYILLCYSKDRIEEMGREKGTTDLDYEVEQTDDEYVLSDLDNMDFYLEILFQDYDFLRVSEYVKYFIQNPFDFQGTFNVDLTEYEDLMPNDIRKEFNDLKQSIYPTEIIKQHSNGIIRDMNMKEFFLHIEKIIDYFSHSLTLRGTHKLLWNENGLPKKETSAQQLLESISRLYCESNNIDITPEAETGRGPVDFKFSYGNNLKTIVEIKRGSNKLEHGIEKQTVQYMLSEKVETAYFIIIILFENEFRKVDRIFELAKSIEVRYNLIIRPIIIDARASKLSASKIQNVESVK